MSLEIIKKEIENFIKTDKPEILTINGEWGSGKTHLWNQQIYEHKENMALEKYAYVSLFGIQSLEDFKLAIFQNTITSSFIGLPPSIETFSENTQNQLNKLKRNQPGFKQWVFNRAIGTITRSTNNNYTPLLTNILNLTANKLIICIDDLDRASNNFPIEDILGYALQLKESRDCKIIFLMNEKSEKCNIYKTHREKIADTELEFKPTPEECTEIALQKNNKFREHLKSAAIQLKITNIRILKK